MALWRGLGINVANNFNNYGSYPSVDFNQDIDELLALGFHYFRVALPSWSYAASINVMKQAIIDVIAKGGHVVCGITSSTNNDITSSNWTDYATAALSFVQWAKDTIANPSLIEIQLANELESYNNDASITDAQLRTNIRSLATSSRAIWPNAFLSISVAQGPQANNWISDKNKGDLNYVHLNVYGQSDDYPSFATYIDNFFNVYRDGCITEWNIDPTHSDIVNLSNPDQITNMDAHYFYIREKRIPRAYFFTWRWYGTDDFSLKKSDGTYRDSWLKSLTKIKRCSVVNI